MRASTAVLTDTPIRLWELAFPRTRVLLERTRAAYVALDNLIAFSKRDRDGRVDAYLAAYLPDELVLLFFLGGDLVNAAQLTSMGRFPAAIPEVLRRIQAESERSEVAFHTAPRDLLSAMYASCVRAPQPAPVEATAPEAVFRTLVERRWSGLLELISNGRVNYLTVSEGRYVAGHFADRQPDEAAMTCVSRLFSATPPEPPPRIVVTLHDAPAPLPSQAPPAMVSMFRNFTWDLADLVEREAPGEGAARAERTRQRLMGAHEVLRWVGGTRGTEQADPVVEPDALADGVAAWTRELLAEIEVLQPQSAPRLLRDAARDHRYALSAVKFFEQLPWAVTW
jgi:hypothetical protein